MPLSKSQIIEIQTAAKFNFHRQVRMAEEEKKLKAEVEKALEAAKPKKSDGEAKKGK